MEYITLKQLHDTLTEEDDWREKVQRTTPCSVLKQYHKQMDALDHGTATL